MKKHDGTTKCICHKGLSGYSSVAAPSNIGVGGQETAPQSLSAHTLDRYGQAEKKTTTHQIDNENEILNFYEKRN